MKRILFLLLLISAHCLSSTIAAANTIASYSKRVVDSRSAGAESSIKDKLDDTTDEAYVKVYINKIQNAVGDDCTINGFAVPSDKAAKPIRPLLIPFISIGTYLKEYTSRRAFTPQGALEVLTPYGQFRLWASESGVMYAPDPDGDQSSHDGWKAKKLLGITRDEHGGKKLYLASLVLRAMKDKFNKDKLKMSLQPLR